MEDNVEIGKRANPSREPFSDLSNTASSSVSLPNSRRKRKMKSVSNPPEHGADSNKPLTLSETTLVSLSREIVASSTAGPSDLDSINGDYNFLDRSECSTIYKRRNTRTSEHTADATPSAALSCPPIKQKMKQNKGKKSKKGNGSLIQQVSSSAPCKSRKEPKDFKLPKDFLEEQNNYFKKIDEEELIVEEADSD